VSERDEDVLARWSRRKRAARSGDVRSPTQETPAAGAPAAEPDADRPLGAAGPAVEAAEPLPSLDDIKADGDLSAFLRDGVPTALKNAAMRKMWSLDPAIRDHVGLAEYAWDFNQPGAMRGFSPLEAGKSVADFLSTAGREMPSHPEEPATGAPPPEQPSGLAPEEGAPGPAQPASDAPRQPTEVAVAPGPAEAADHAESAPASRPRHGGALPR
jgi:Protein of unknown function (DUF3306)